LEAPFDDEKAPSSIEPERHAMFGFSKQLFSLATLISIAAVPCSEAKVLRNNAPAVLVFKDVEALSRFNRLKGNASGDESLLAPLLTCKAPQESKIEVLGSGHRTAFVRVIEGSAAGCEGTVPIGAVRD
jgi:hypothetical protein